jgi:hypothetical protein
MELDAIIARSRLLRRKHRFSHSPRLDKIPTVNLQRR